MYIEPEKNQQPVPRFFHPSVCQLKIVVYICILFIVTKQPKIMIQRVQSVYLFLVFAFFFLFFVLPLAHFPAVVPEMSLRLVTYHDFFTAVDISGAWMAVVLIILFALAVLITVYTTFLYRKRLSQIRFGKYNMFIHAAIILISFFFIDSIRGQVNDAGFSYGAGIFFPVISLIFILMANRAIRKDENLVRSANRIR